jgi:hypothetical protein
MFDEFKMEKTKWTQFLARSHSTGITLRYTTLGRKNFNFPMRPLHILSTPVGVANESISQSISQSVAGIFFVNSKMQWLAIFFNSKMSEIVVSKEAGKISQPD